MSANALYALAFLYSGGKLRRYLREARQRSKRIQVQSCKLVGIQLLCCACFVLRCLMFLHKIVLGRETFDGTPHPLPPTHLFFFISKNALKGQSKLWPHMRTTRCALHTRTHARTRTCTRTASMWRCDTGCCFAGVIAQRFFYPWCFYWFPEVQ